MSNYDQAMQEAKKLAANPQAKEFVRQLQQKDPQLVQTLLQQAAAGNFSQAKQMLTALLEDPQTRVILESLGGSNGDKS